MIHVMVDPDLASHLGRGTAPIQRQTSIISITIDMVFDVAQERLDRIGHLRRGITHPMSLLVDFGDRSLRLNVF
jgi:hypothetical protein